MIGQECLAIKDKVFEVWHLYRGGGMAWEMMDEKMATLMLQLMAGARKGQSVKS